MNRDEAYVYTLLVFAAGWGMVAFGLTKQRLSYTGWPGDGWMIGVPTVLAWFATFVAFHLALTVSRNIKEKP